MYTFILPLYTHNVLFLPLSLSIYYSMPCGIGDLPCGIGEIYLSTVPRFQYIILRKSSIYFSRTVAEGVPKRLSHIVCHVESAICHLE